MPWIKDENGEDKYIASRYTKEELPTWNEVYNKWYKGCSGDLYQFKPNRDVERDTYWKIQKKLFLLAIVCNQFNKMMYEDGYINKINDLFEGEYDNIAFELVPITTDKNKFPIYSISNPKGNDNPFIDKSNRVFISKDINECIELQLRSKNGKRTSETFKYMRDKAVNILMEPFIEYFENGIGWKDENGKLIENNKERWDRASDSAL